MVWAKTCRELLANRTGGLAGKLLTTTGSIGADHVLRYLALKRDCEVCPLKPQCVVRRRRHARSHAISMRTPAITLAR
jgi:hypothetical protein